VVCHARQALLANHADQTLTLSTDLISSCSIASNVPRSSCPLDFVAMHPHWGGITAAHTSCRDVSLYRTWSKGIMIQNTCEHRINDTQLWAKCVNIVLVLQNWGNQCLVFILSPLNGASCGRRPSLSSPPRVVTIRYQLS
jgi:hypothetical protein